MPRARRSHWRVVIPLLLTIAAMGGLVSYSATLYRLFCAATGYNGTTQRVLADTAAETGRAVTVRFETQTAPDLPWRFAPVQSEVRVHLGEEKLVFFAARNLSDKPLIGHATFNVTPYKAGPYFNKIQCFCFSDERLGPGESATMPVDFYVDPALDQDANAKDLTVITLSYTFFPSADPTDIKDLSRFDPNAPPDAARGRELFAERCAACHGLDENKGGPMLGGVFGREAGTAAGYPYSAALKNWGRAWDEASLDRWLADPPVFIPGVKMPIRVLDANTRRDIVAYLKAESERPQAAR